MIASIAFRNFKALRNTRIALSPFNLIIGPNGSGKTSLLESLQRLRSLSRLEPNPDGPESRAPDSPEIAFGFEAPHAEITVRISCTSDVSCDRLSVEPPDAPGWPRLRAELDTVRNYLFDHGAMAGSALRADGKSLAGDGGNLAAVLVQLRESVPESYSALTAEVLRIMPEFRAIELTEHAESRCELGLRLSENDLIPAAELSQGTLFLLGLLTLAFNPEPPRLICIEEVDRGIHPRMLREIRDTLYRLSYPGAFGLDRRPVQVVTTTHSPYLIDLFRDHPDEVIISQKRGRAARFERLSERADLPELLREGSLGDMWFSGILGGVPEE